METTLDQLVEHSDRLLMEIQGDTDLPLITRSIEQMGVFGEKLCSTLGVRSDVKAARLLGSTVNYDLPKKLTEKLESLNAVGDVDFLQPHSEMDIHTYLRCERENILLTASEQAKQSAYEEANAICRHANAAWWKRQASAILTALASSAGPLDTDIQCSLSAVNDSAVHRLGNLSSSWDTTLIDGLDRQAPLSREELFYAQQIDHFLADTISSTKGVYGRMAATSCLLSKPILFDYLYPESKLSTGISTLSDGSKNSDLFEVLRLIRRMLAPSASLVDLNSETPLADLLLPTGKCANERAAEFRVGRQLQLSLLARAIAHLEMEFIDYLKAMVSANPRQAQLGGRPGTRSLVRACLNLMPLGGCVNAPETGFESFCDYEDGLVDGKPVWPMIYYCLRCGALQDAVSIASDADNNLGNFSQILESFLREERQLPLKTINNLRKTYRRVVKASRDPYKRLVYCLLGRCELSDAHTEVAQSIDDFLWLRLSQVTVTGTVTGGDEDEEVFSLGQLQTQLYDTYGEAHFDASNQPFVYVKLLCLSQQFEGAIGFLSRIESLRCHAAHMAILLRNMKILLLPTSVQTPLISKNDCDPAGLRRLNFARLLLLYTRKFEMSNPCQALNYYYFLSDVEASLTEEDLESVIATPGTLVKMNSENTDPKSKSSQSGNLFIQCVTELVIQTREFDLLLGFLGEDGIRQPGAIDRFCADGTGVTSRRLIATVAETLEARGQLMDAVRVYLLSGAATHLLSAVRLANLLLVAVVCGSGGNDAESETTKSSQSDRSAILRVASEVGHNIQRINMPPTGSSGDRMLGAGGGSQTEIGTVSIKSASQTLFYLLDLAVFFDLANAGQWQAALDHMDRLGIFPSNSNAAHLESKVTAFAVLPDLVRRPLPNALLQLMRCLIAKAGQTKSSSDSSEICWNAMGGETAKSPSVSEARSRARTLITFVGRIPHRMPGEVYARLSQLEMQLS